MKAITIWGAWAAAIMHLDKRVENRVWSPSSTELSGAFALHSGVNLGATSSRSAADREINGVIDMAYRAGWLCRWVAPGVTVFKRGNETAVIEWPKVPLGQVFAVAQLGGMLYTPEGEDPRRPWCVPGQHHWVLANVKMLKNPVACRGRQRLWNLPPLVERAVRAQL